MGNWSQPDKPFSKRNFARKRRQHIGLREFTIYYDCLFTCTTPLPGL